MMSRACVVLLCAPVAACAVRAEPGQDREITNVAVTAAPQCSGPSANDARPREALPTTYGVYASVFGFVVLERRGSVVSGHYSNGSMHCTERDQNLTCSWREGALTGHSRFTPESHGVLRGSWGSGPSATDGGDWILVPIERRGAASFAGKYASDFGDVSIRQDGDRVHATYPSGSMGCVALGDSLDCGWTEAELIGKALLTRQPNGNVVGTWGRGTSATDGGPWLLVPR